MHLEWSDTDPLLQPMAAAAQEGAATCRQFFQSEWLAEHIVGSSIKQ